MHPKNLNSAECDYRKGKKGTQPILFGTIIATELLLKYFRNYKHIGTQFALLKSRFSLLSTWQKARKWLARSATTFERKIFQG